MVVALLDLTPDPLRPTKPPSLPQWLEEPLMFLKKATRRDQAGRLREIFVLPSRQIPNQSQRREIEGYIEVLVGFDEMTPDRNQRHSAVTLTAVSKMIMALGGKKFSDLTGEAKGEAYMVALNDVPCWAVEEALRKWYRGEFEKEYDYSFPPAPAILRKHARDEQYLVRYRGQRLRELLQAEQEDGI
jgi:hypothetical protein